MIAYHKLAMRCEQLLDKGSGIRIVGRIAQDLEGLGCLWLLLPQGHRETRGNQTQGFQQGRGRLTRASSDSDSEVIYAYTRAQALDDGILVDATALAKEAGFKWPVAVTTLSGIAISSPHSTSSLMARVSTGAYGIC